MAGLKTSIKDIPLANDHLLEETARMNKITKGEAKHVIDFVGNYIYDVIRKGTMEGVMLPYFGKFKPKAAKLNRMNKVKMNKRNGKDMIYRALNGMQLLDYRLEELKDKGNETV